MFQQTIIIGNLDSDPETHRTTTGEAECIFPVVVTERWTDANGIPQERVTRYRVATSGRLAEVCSEYLNKGRQIMVVGSASVSARIDERGEARATLELTARDVKFLDGHDDAFQRTRGNDNASTTT
jgi:single-strand DNA-binding protein